MQADVTSLYNVRVMCGWLVGSRLGSEVEQFARWDGTQRAVVKAISSAVTNSNLALAYV